MRVHNSWTAVTALMLGCCLASVCLAAHYWGPNSGGHSHNNNNPPATAPSAVPPPAQPAVPSQLSVDEAAQSAAADEFAKDQQNLKALADAAWDKFQLTPEWATAAAKLTSAKYDLDAAKAAAKETLANNPDYKDALAAKKKAVDDLAAAKAGGDATPEILSPLATASLQASINITKIETEALANDTGVQSASGKLEIAQHDADMLKLKFQQTLSADKQYAEAKALVDAARRRFDDAHAKVVSDSGSN